MALLSSSPTLKFSSYEVDLRAGELCKNGLRIRLQEKPLRVLELLAKGRGQLVTREELKQNLWPSDTFIDFETGLNTAVKKLRAALSDDADHPRYIETIPRRGYRFLVPVQFSAGSIAPVQAPPDPPAAPAREIAAVAPADVQAAAVAARRAGERVGVRLAAAATLALVTALVWWLTPLPDPSIQNITRLTYSGRQDFLVRPATDGVRLFFVQRSGDHYDLMQVSVNGGEAQKVGAPFRNSLIWDVSADGSQYLLTSFEHRGQPAPLWAWPATGGLPVKLDDLVSGSATWSPNGKWIALHSGHDLLVAGADGSAKRILHRFQEDPDNPVWSSDGQRIRFTLNNPDHDTHSMWEIRLDGRGLHQILSDWSKTTQVCCGMWSPDGRYFVFIETSRPARLWALRESGSWWRRSPRGPFLIASEATGSLSPLIAKDGTRVYFYGYSLTETLERFDVISHQPTAFLPDMHATLPSFSRDGQWVAYVQLNTGSLWRSRADGRDAQQIFTSDLRATFPRWSPDGRTLAFTGQRRGEEANVYIVSAEGGRPQLLSASGAVLTDADWSPDDKSVVAVRRPSSPPNARGGSTLTVFDLKARQAEDLAGSENFYVPRWSPDGRWIAALSGNSQALELYDRSTKTWVAVARGQYLSLPAWSAHGAYLYFQDLLAPGEPLFRRKPNSGNVETVADFQNVLSSGVQRCAFLGLTPTDEPLFGFRRGTADLYGASLSLP